MGLRIRQRTPSREALTAPAIVGFVVAALSFVVATAAGFLFGWPVLPGLLAKGLLASFLASFVVAMFTKSSK